MLPKSKRKGKFLSKAEAAELLNKAAQMREIREKELNSFDPTIKGGIIVTVMTSHLPNKDKPSEAHRRSGRCGLEQHAVYRWSLKTPYWKIQEKIALNRR